MEQPFAGVGRVQGDLLDQPGKPKRRKRPPAAEVTPETPIWCPWCEEEHPASAFNKEADATADFPASVARLRPRSASCRSSARRIRLATDVDGLIRCIASGASPRREAEEGLRAKTTSVALADVCSGSSMNGSAKAASTVDTVTSERLIPTTWSVPRRPDMYRALFSFASHRPTEVRAGRSACRGARGAIDSSLNGNGLPKTGFAGRLPPSWQQRIDMQDANDSIKLVRGCADCGWAKWARGLDWDHVRGPKVSTIAIMISRAGLVAGDRGRRWQSVRWSARTATASVRMSVGA